MERIVLVAVLAFGVTAAGGEQPPARSGERAAGSSQKKEAEASRVYRDPQTGVLGRPDAPSALVRRAPARTAPSPAYRLPNGAVALRTRVDEMDFAVVKRSPDGSLSFSCAQGSGTEPVPARRRNQEDEQ
jgi:hypothetical protein